MEYDNIKLIVNSTQQEIAKAVKNDCWLQAHELVESLLRLVNVPVIDQKILSYEAVD
jgi:hypothetical protein